MSAADRSRTFYGGIGLPLGNVEEDALKARYSFTHGDKSQSDVQSVALARHQIAYSTLASRVILRLLDYRGRYIDYTSANHGERALNEPLAGISVHDEELALRRST